MTADGTAIHNSIVACLISSRPKMLLRLVGLETLTVQHSRATCPCRTTTATAPFPRWCIHLKTRCKSGTVSPFSRPTASRLAFMQTLVYGIQISLLRGPVAVSRAKRVASAGRQSPVDLGLDQMRPWTLQDQGEFSFFTVSGGR